VARVEIQNPQGSMAKSITVYYCGYEKCESCHAFGPAVRTQYLLHFVISGKGKYSVGGETYPVAAGQAFLIKPSELTYYQADRRDPWEYMWVAFDGIDGKEVVRRTGFAASYVVSIPQPREFQNCLSGIIAQFQEGAGSEYRILSYFYGAMAQLEHGEKAGSYEEEYLGKAIRYIQNNYSYPVKIADLARYVGVDRTYLYKIFRDREGYSPKQYLLLVRIDAAKNMLRTQRYSVGEIALSCGFSDVPSFCKHFKKLTGTTPGQFMRELKRLEG
jgi:AraC-like DNA-binding protein